MKPSWESNWSSISLVSQVFHILHGRKWSRAKCPSCISLATVVKAMPYPHFYVHNSAYCFLEYKRTCGYINTLTKKLSITLPHAACEKQSWQRKHYQIIWDNNCFLYIQGGWCWEPFSFLTSIVILVLFGSMLHALERQFLTASSFLFQNFSTALQS